VSVVERTRYIYSRFGVRQVGDLLQLIFASELVQPSRRLWIVSPWISDIPILDNTGNAFTSVAPEWSRSHVRLSSMLARLLDSECSVDIATREAESHNRDFLDKLRDLVGDHPGLRIHLAADLHEKGILGDSFYLAGSMNFTHSGISVNEEAVQFTNEPAVIAQNQITFRSRWKR
jgi:hypothetical protein